MIYYNPPLRCPHCEYLARSFGTLRRHSNKHENPAGMWLPVESEFDPKQPRTVKAP